MNLRAPTHPQPYPHDREVLAAFEHSGEGQALMSEGMEPRFVAPLLDLANALWIEPDDITGPILIELLHDLQSLQRYRRHQIPAVLRELRGFWSFAGREYRYPYAGECLDVLERDAALALECALQPKTHSSPRITRHRVGHV